MKTTIIPYLNHDLALHFSNVRNPFKPFSINGVLYTWSAKYACFKLSAGVYLDSSWVYTDLLGLRNVTIGETI